MNIYSRWGQHLFSTNNLNIGWDGKVNGGSEIAEMDIYVYVINVKAITDKHDYTYRGALNLIK